MSDDYSEYLSKNYVEKLLRPKLPRNKTLYKQVKDSLSPRDHDGLENEWHDTSHRFMPQTTGVIDADGWGRNLEKHLQRLSDAYVKAWEHRSRKKTDFKFFKVLETLLAEELYKRWKSIKKNPFLHRSPDESDDVKAHTENNLNWSGLSAYNALGNDLRALMDRYRVQSATEQPNVQKRKEIVRDIITKPKYLSKSPDELSENGKAELAKLFDHLTYYQIPLPEKGPKGSRTASTATWEDLAHIAKHGTEDSREELVDEYKRVMAVLYRDIHSKK